MSPQKLSDKNVYILVAVLITILIVIALMGEEKNNRTKNEQTIPSGIVYTKENIDVVKVDVTTEKGREKLPPGFPADIPIETTSMVDSEKNTYTDRGVTSYNVSFYSSKSGLEKFNEYEKYMLGVKYRFGEGNRDKSKLFLYGTKTEGDMSVNISTKEGRTFVVISYLQK